MNARIVFFLTLAFGLLNLVFGVISLLSTPDGWLIAHFVLAVLSIIALLPIAAMAWPGVVKPRGDSGDRWDRTNGWTPLTLDEDTYGYSGASSDD